MRLSHARSGQLRSLGLQHALRASERVTTSSAWRPKLSQLKEATEVKKVDAERQVCKSSRPVRLNPSDVSAQPSLSCE